jgi:Zn-dependent peptidase ImmA (M78 family)
MFTLADLHEFGFSQDHFLRLNSLDSNFFACMVPTPAGHILINNTNSSQNRSNSNIVHELSHVICEHNFSSIKPINGSILREFDQDSEDEANWLAGCLLLPREGLLWAHKKGLSIKQISNHFGTSEQMSRWRFNVTGVTKQIPGRRFSNSNN